MIISIEKPCVILLTNGDDDFEFDIQYNCVACCHTKVRGYVINILDKLTNSELAQFDCSPRPKLIKTIVERHTNFTDVQINYCVEALVLAQAKLNGIPVKILVTWQNCD